MEDGKKCVVVLFIHETLLTAGQQNGVTAASWAIGFDSGLRYHFVTVTVHTECGNSRLLCNACPLFFSTGGKCRRGLNLTTNIYPVRRLQMRQIPSYTCPLVCTYAQRLIIVVQSSDAQIPGDYILNGSASYLWALGVDLASCDPFSA